MSKRTFSTLPERQPVAPLLSSRVPPVATEWWRIVADRHKSEQRTVLVHEDNTTTVTVIKNVRASISPLSSH
ncbi:hypothetical protein HYR99_28240 [Candidatus Poribacteria bacterium]|nr:hypothetical protein [Candidatus Poribacteria bacterium]